MISWDFDFGSDGEMAWNRGSDGPGVRRHKPRSTGTNGERRTGCPKVIGPPGPSPVTGQNARAQREGLTQESYTGDANLDSEPVPLTRGPLMG